MDVAAGDPPGEGGGPSVWCLVEAVPARFVVHSDQHQRVAGQHGAAQQPGGDQRQRVHDRTARISERRPGRPDERRLSAGRGTSRRLSAFRRPS